MISAVLYVFLQNSNKYGISLAIRSRLSASVVRYWYHLISISSPFYDVVMRIFLSTPPSCYNLTKNLVIGSSCVRVGSRTKGRGLPAWELSVFCYLLGFVDLISVGFMSIFGMLFEIRHYSHVNTILNLCHFFKSRLDFLEYGTFLKSTIFFTSSPIYVER